MYCVPLFYDASSSDQPIIFNAFPSFPGLIWRRTVVLPCVQAHALRSLRSGLVVTFLWRPLGVSVVVTWALPGSDKKLYLWAALLRLPVICLLSLCLYSSSFLGISLCPCLWNNDILSFYYSSFHSYFAVKARQIRSSTGDDRLPVL